jgi:hypothetical protein
MHVVIPIPQSRERNLALVGGGRAQSEISRGVYPERTGESLLPRLRDQDHSEGLGMTPAMSSRSFYEVSLWLWLVRFAGKARNMEIG